VYLLDDARCPVRHGEPGEIFIGGAGVARGYVNLPARERERFVPEPPPAGSRPGVRMYRTGDLGRLDSEGDLERLGRASSRLERRGTSPEPARTQSAPAIRGAQRRDER
jgi:non-ribosomal peptide synthetase component F